MKKRAIVAGILGLWVLVTAFVGFGHMAILASNLITGFILFVLGFAFVKERPWQGWTIFLLSFWLCVSGYLVDLHVGTDLIVNNTTTGALIVVAAFSILMQKNVDKETG